MKGFPTQEQVDLIKEQYPIGTRLKLVSMQDAYCSVPSGSEGEVTHIDDIGTLYK